VPWIWALRLGAMEGVLVPFLGFMAAVILIGLAAAHSSVHGSHNTKSFWQWLASGGPIADLLGLGIKAARYVVSHFAASQLRVMARWLFSMGTLTRAWFGVQAVLAEVAADAIEHLYHRGDPKARARAQAANRQAVKAGHAAEHANAHARTVGHDLARYKGRTGTRLHHLAHRVEVVLPRDIGRVKHRERWAERQLWKVRDRVIDLEHGAIKTWDWIMDHPAGAAAGAFTGALAAVLSWPAIRALRCNEFGNLFNKRGCGLWNDLDALLATLAVVVGTVSLVEFAREEQKLMDEWAKIVRGLWEV